jgi:hypothetical protein
MLRLLFSRRIVISVVTFSVFATAGPLLRLLHPSSVTYYDQQVTSLILFLCPTIIGSGGSGVGPQVLVMVLLSNLLLFALYGLLVGIVSRNHQFAALAYLATCVSLALFASWDAGFNIRYFDWLPFVVACAAYGVAFSVMSVVLKKFGATQQPANQVTGL